MADTEDDEWVPLSRRGTDGEQEYRVLVEGVPHWLNNSLWRWVMDRRATGKETLIRAAERRLRITMPSGENPFDVFWTQASDDERLEMVDFLLDFLFRRYKSSHEINAFEPDDIREASLAAATSLSNMLKEASSAWRVAGTQTAGWRLERRVSEVATTQFESAVSHRTHASNSLRKAWAACYRRDADYSEAYRQAVFAVEGAILPLASPGDPQGTLGKARSHIAQTVERWGVAGLESDRQASGETLLAMLNTLWFNQKRHAGPDGTIKDVTREEAEAAVGIAVLLVHLVESGLVTVAPRKGRAEAASG